MKLKMISAVALAVATLAAGGARADTVTDLGVITSLKTFGGFAAPGLFTDIFQFSLPANGGSQYSLTNFSVAPLFPEILNTGFATFMLVSDPDGDLATFDGAVLSTQVFNPLTANVALNYTGTAGGNYYLFVTGATSGSLGGAYNGAISVTAVPEPETYAMMLAGLAALGFLARRRQG
jgi:PEP-CTERM motif